MQQQAGITLMIDGIRNGETIPERFAHCRADGRGASADSENVRPAMRWFGAPAGAKSFAVVVVDKDVPKSFDDANKPGRSIAENFPRKDFYHWVQVDIPARATGLAEGTGAPEAGLSGINSFGARGRKQGLGYDGPCPPWNDERLHHYHFIIYALDVPTLGLAGKFSGAEAVKAMEGHVLAQGEVVGHYTTNLHMMRKAAA